jgi:glutamate N-acetyltransferase/amino-acid N-acetyltransferase
MLPAVAQAALRLEGGENAGVAAAKAIMTTDTFPKLRSATVTLSDGSVGRIVGVAKGAGG